MSFQIIEQLQQKDNMLAVKQLCRVLDILTFVNADYIARGLSGRHTDAVAFEAERIILKRLRQLAAAREDVAFESTLSSRTFASFLTRLKTDGYQVSIYYFALSNAQLAVRRVKLRVSLGGHAVPTDVVRRRFGRSLKNFMTLYAPLASRWAVFDNSSLADARLVAAHSDNQLTVKEPALWRKLQKLATSL